MPRPITVCDPSATISGPPARSRILGGAVAVTVLAGAFIAFVAPAPRAEAAVLAPNDYCLEECSDILPPGQNGNATLADILAHQAFGTRPAHSADQLDPYARLVYNYAGLTDDQIGGYFNNASFGVPAGQVERSYQPRPDVTIVRDRATGTPHITGSTRSGTMYGAGYAGAEDRLFTMDLLRHVGRGTLTSFAGGAPGNRALEQSVWRNSPYTENDLAAQVAALRQRGPRGEQLYADVQSFVAGVNAYITTCMARRNCPGEYVLTGHLDAITNEGGPVPFTMTDLIAIAGVVGGLFGGGGGAEMQSALVRIAARARYGPAEGDAIWAAFRQQNDPETVLTLHDGQSFPSGAASPDAPSVVLPDRGTATVEPVVTDQTGSATTATGASSLIGALSGLTIGPARRGMSNAVVISARHSATGHPIAVFGPQTGYFTPQLLMVQELQGPGISARGAAFAGLNMYVLLGRGPDYAWSATSSVHDITDTYAVPLCTVDGSAPTLASNRYLYRGQCLAMDELSHVNSWRPTLADGTPAGSYKLITWRTKLGLVAWRGMVGGRPHAFTQLRSTYRHEADSAIGFQMFNDPAEMGTANAFLTAAATIGYAFNWFYINSTQVGYYNSGLNPVRAAGSNPNLPMKAEPAYEWQGFNPDTNTAAYATPAQHPQSTGQDYFISWNNKQAKDFSAADGNFSFGAVHRGDLLDGGVRAAIQAGQKLDRAGVVKLVERAAVADLRGTEVLDDLLRVLESQPVTEPALVGAVDKLKSWRQAGAVRVETAAGSKVYQHADAIRIFDAWWPLLVNAQFKPALGADLYQALVNTLQVNESPSGRQQGDLASLPPAGEPRTHVGSAFQYGWWGYVEKDLRAVLGDPVAGGLGRTYCGNGDLAGCRSALLDTLRTAAGQAASTVYPGDGNCAAGDQWCADAILQSPLGGITNQPIAWQNRPTYQQAVSFPAARGQDITNLAMNGAVTASSTQFGHPARSAVDGNPTSRWSSAFSDNQWITVDLGTNRSVGRTVLRWEAAYGSAYRIEVSTDGTTWTTVWSTAAGNGGTDVNVFSPTTARYVRMAGVRRATSYGFSLWELEVYAH